MESIVDVSVAVVFVLDVIVDDNVVIVFIKGDTSAVIGSFMDNVVVGAIIAVAKLSATEVIIAGKVGVIVGATVAAVIDAFVVVIVNPVAISVVLGGNAFVTVASEVICVGKTETVLIADGNAVFEFIPLFPIVNFVDEYGLIIVEENFLTWSTDPGIMRIILFRLYGGC